MNSLPRDSKEKSAITNSPEDSLILIVSPNIVINYDISVLRQRILTTIDVCSAIEDKFVRE